MNFTDHRDQTNASRKRKSIIAGCYTLGALAIATLLPLLNTIHHLVWWVGDSRPYYYFMILDVDTDS